MPENYKTIQDGLSGYVKTGTIIFLILALLFIIFIVYSIRRKRRMILEKKQIEFHYQQELLRTQLEIQEQTLKNISQEIHDNVGQVLALAKLNLNTMDIAKTEQLQGKIGNTLMQVSKAISDLRDLSKSFNTDNISAIGLISAIAYELDMIGKTGSHETEFKITGNSLRLEPQKELILFRIVQETLHNIIKHAEAKSIKIFANYTDRELELEVTDDGKGSNLSPLNIEKNPGSGLGIRNMQNRAKLIGAGFNMSSTPGAGTIVKITLPFESGQVTTK